LTTVEDYGEAAYYYGDYYNDDDIVIDNTASGNDATSGYGTATSGNSNEIDEIRGAGAKIDNEATDNDAYVYGYGVALSGN